VIYLDTSVILAQLLAEDVHPEDSFWSTGPFVSSRLLQYEVWNRIHAMDLGESHGEDVNEVLGGLAFLELTPPVLARALDPFPLPVRTLDALHLASMEFLRTHGQRPRLASYDRRLSDAATALDIPLVNMGEAPSTGSA
jgi:predicted nucleic acid-binding protein